MTTASTANTAVSINSVLHSSVPENIQNSILYALSKGFVPIPLIGKCPKFDAWTKVTRDTCINVINDKFKQGFANVGVMCGKPSGVVVVDIDNKDAGMETWIKLVTQYGEPQTFKILTGSKGLHYYFLYDSDTESLKSRSKAVIFDGKAVGIDIKSNGGQVVFHGSKHPDTGNIYQVLANLDGTIPSIIKMPDWLLALLLATERTNKPQIAPVSRSKLIDASGVSLETVAKHQDSEAIQTISLEAITDLVNKLNVTRASNYDDWYRVIYAIKATSTEFFEVAKEFSKRTTRNNYDESSIKTMWDRADGSITFGSLMYWLKQDIGVEAYNKFLLDHKLICPQIIVKDAFTENINSHNSMMTWHALIVKYNHTHLYEDEAFVKDLVQCVALIVGADEKYFVKERYVQVRDNPESYGSLVYNLAKSTSFKKIATSYCVTKDVLQANGLKQPERFDFTYFIQKYVSRYPYHSVDFLPAGNQPGVINLFTGLRARKVTFNINDFQELFIHTREVLCNGDEICHEYFLNKLAYFFQTLGIKKVGIADLMVSEPGAGKNIFYVHLGRYILGNQYWYITSDINKLIGRFNKCLMGKLLIIGDEAKGHGKNAEMLKLYDH